MDLIDRQQLLQHFDNCLKTGGFNAYIVAMQCYVEQMPTVEPKRGRWLDRKGAEAKITIEVMSGDKMICPQDAFCSECGDWLCASDEYAATGNFCPNCGADMRGEEDD